jgi:hypothetical protein
MRPYVRIWVFNRFHAFIDETFSRATSAVVLML